jgi:hypothetical protein
MEALFTEKHVRRLPNLINNQVFSNGQKLEGLPGFFAGGNQDKTRNQL